MGALVSLLSTYLTIKATLLILRIVLFLTLLIGLYKLFHATLEKLAYVLPPEYTNMLGCFLPDNMSDFIMAICLAKIAVAIFNTKSRILSFF